MEVSKKTKGLNIALLILRIVYFVVYLAITMIILVNGIKGHYEFMKNPEITAPGLGYALLLIIVGLTGYGTNTIIGIPILVISIINKEAKHKVFNIISSSVMLILPFVTWGILCALNNVFFPSA